MKLFVKNLAKIREANIDINGITVIAGENSTGKSTLGKILYTIFGTFNYEKSIHNERSEALLNKVKKYTSSKPNVDVFDGIGDFFEFLNPFKKSQLSRLIVENIIEIFDISDSQEKFFKIAKNIIRKSSLDFIDMDEFINEAYQILSTDIKVLMNRQLLKNLKVEFENQYTSLFNQNGLYVNLNVGDDLITFETEENCQDVGISSMSFIVNHIVYLDNPSLIENVNKYLLFNDKSFVKHEEYLEKQLANSPDSLSVYDNILQEELLYKIINEIKSLVNGEFVFDDGLLKFKENKIEPYIELRNLSSGVKTFCTLLKLIENGVLEKNGTIILDEPEIQLHPKWQLKYAELLVVLQKTLNLNILISSHSPYFIKAIEVYSAKHNLNDISKFYLAELNDDGMSVFVDVTQEVDKIYEKLAIPLQDLANEECELKLNDY